MHLFPNDDELNYKKLGSVQNGGDAMDTFAMVRIWEKLHPYHKTRGRTFGSKL